MCRTQHTPPACAIATTIATKTNICKEHVRLELVTPAFPESDPGQFVQIRCAPNGDNPPHEIEWQEGTLPVLTGNDWSEDATLLRRPFSLADRWDDRDGNTHLVIISRTVGRGTRWLETVNVGDELNITGPLGNGFRTENIDRPILLVGGGVGIPPLLYLARRLKNLGAKDVTAVFGVMTRDLMPVTLLTSPTDDGTPTPCVELPDDANYSSALTTDDGSLGLKGRVTDAIRRWHIDRGQSDLKPIVYSCGPEPMLHAVAQQTRELDMDCQLCIERMMGCGMGTCLSCVVRVHDDTKETGTRWALTCSDGPVFDRDELVDAD